MGRGVVYVSVVRVLFWLSSIPFGGGALSVCDYVQVFDLLYTNGYCMSILKLFALLLCVGWEW